MKDLASHLKDLNPEQLAAVRHGQGPLLIFAGAGSGKTRVLTRRIANLIIEHDVRPDEILAVTFTNKAAAEMKHRVSQLFGREQLPIWVSTFHAAGVRILRSYAKYLDFTAQFAIYDSSDTVSALKRVYERLNIDPKMVDLKMVRARIDKAKNDYKFPADIREDKYTPRPLAIMIADIYEEYQAELRSSNAMDFGDLLCNIITLFRLEPKILASFQERFKHLLVDEYQDTNKVQYMLVRMLTEKRQNLCVVGDDDQSIYAFRGANIENILNFKKDYPETKIITLETNYRSTKNILDAANAVISKNQRRQKKKMRTENPAGKSIVYFKGFDEYDEAKFVAQEIAVLFNAGVPASEIAIFYRTNAQSRAIEEALCENTIPYEIYGGHRFYDRKEIKDILGYFRLLLNISDNEAFLRVINTPARGIGATSVAGLISYANREKLPLFVALEKGLKEKAPFITTASRGKFQNFVTLVRELEVDGITAEGILQDRSGTIPASTQGNAIAQLLQEIGTKSGYLQKLKAEDTLESESRLENIYELFGVAAEFGKRSLGNEETPSIKDFLDRAALASDLDKDENKANEEKAEKPETEAELKEELSRKRGKGGTVSLMTLHLAKGLEFQVVFLVGLEEGLLPHVRSFEDREGLEEERRLCYVGITRARSQLYLARAVSRQTFGRSNWYTGEPSRFLEDLPQHLIDHKRKEYWS